MANHKEYIERAKKIVGDDRVYTDQLRRVAWGTDAGFYHMVPQAVVMPKNQQQVEQLLEASDTLNVPVTFRAAGTSLSGQAISEDILIIAGKDWEGYTIGREAATITLQPGIIGDRVNQILKPFGRMFAPDPASKKSAMVGGIICNNASGMNCGTHANSDQVLLSVRIVLPDGTPLDTADPQSRRAFEQSHPELIKEIIAIRDYISSHPQIHQRIEKKYAIKNVTGLNLRPFIAYTDPFDIITHLIVGSEGTLAFLSEATVNTSHLYPYSASAMLYFQQMPEACRAIVALKGTGVFSAEMLDFKSLESVNDTTGKDLTAVLVETKGDTKEEVQGKIDQIMATLHKFDLYKEPQWLFAPHDAPLWQMRSGVFPAVGGTRPEGTTVLIEDVAFPIKDLPEATVKLRDLLVRNGYDDACIYGHALEGNYHFVIAQRFDTPQEIERYKRLMAEVEHLVVDEYDGSLKAEHGTGRNMAPFVAKEWGEDVFELMKRVKKAFDPKGLLNPGVIFNDDPECYIKNIKKLPPMGFSKVFDKCIECGFCEVNCVSCGPWLSARQRIVIIRNMKEDQTKYPGFDPMVDHFCAGDGLCSTSCPMGINVGDLVHEIRQRKHAPGTLAYGLGKAACNNLGFISRALQIPLGAARLLPYPYGAMRPIHLKDGKATFETPNVPGSSNFPVSSNVADSKEEPRKCVYLPSCINRTFGPEEKGDRPLIEEMKELCEKAGYVVIFPKGLKSLCCGMIWDSKGMPDIANQKAEETHKALLEASEDGRYPIVCDQSPCLHTLREHIKDLKLYEPAEFITKFLAPYLEFQPKQEPVAVHVTCSTRKMGLGNTIIELARKCASPVIVPEEVGCCGFAGDKGFRHPRLNAWGLRKLRPDLQHNPRPPRQGYSNSRTCEIGLTEHGGIPYKSIVYLVNSVTTPRKSQGE